MTRARAGWIAALVLLAGCEGPSFSFPWDFERMLDQPRAEAYGETPLFEDRRTMRTPPAGTVPHGPPSTWRPATAERGAAGTARPVVDRALLERGGEAFAAFCAPCHGLDGRAATPVAQSMRLRPPPSLHEARLRALAPTDLRGVVVLGFGLMPSYGGLVSEAEAWAIAFYVKALQRAEGSRLADLPPDVRARAEAALRAEGPRR